MLLSPSIHLYFYTMLIISLVQRDLISLISKISQIRYNIVYIQYKNYNTYNNKYWDFVSYYHVLSGNYNLIMEKISEDMNFRQKIKKKSN